MTSAEQYSGSKSVTASVLSGVFYIFFFFEKPTSITYTDTRNVISGSINYVYRRVDISCDRRTLRITLGAFFYWVQKTGNVQNSRLNWTRGRDTNKSFRVHLNRIYPYSFVWKTVTTIIGLAANEEQTNSATAVRV